MDKEDVVPIYNEIVLCHKKNKTMTISVTQMDPALWKLNKHSYLGLRDKAEQASDLASNLSGQGPE